MSPTNSRFSKHTYLQLKKNPEGEKYHQNDSSIADGEKLKGKRVFDIFQPLLRVVGPSLVIPSTPSPHDPNVCVRVCACMSFCFGWLTLPRKKRKILTIAIIPFHSPTLSCLSSLALLCYHTCVRGRVRVRLWCVCSSSNQSWRHDVDVLSCQFM